MTTAALDLDVLRAERCVAIVRGTSVEHFLRTAQTLVQAGVHVLEFPLTTLGVLAALRPIVDELGAGAHVGTGSVTTVAEAKASFEAGAQFLVTPNLNLEVLQYAGSVGLPILVGAFSPTEIFTAWNAGATAVKLFPASLGGPKYMGELNRGPFPNIPLIPTGGVKIADVPDYLQAGAVAFGMGGDLLGSAPNGGSQDDLRSRIQKFRASITR